MNIFELLKDLIENLSKVVFELNRLNNNLEKIFNNKTPTL